MGGNNRSSVSPVVGSESVRLGVLSGAPDPHDFDTSSSVFSVLFTAKLGGDDTTETVPLNRLWVSSNPTVEQLDSNQKELLDALLSSDPASTLDILQKWAHKDARQQAAELKRVARDDDAARKGGPVSTSTDRAVKREVIDMLLREFKWATAVMDSWFAVVQSQWGAPSHSTVLDEFIDVLFPDIQREAPTLWSLVTALATGVVPKQTKDGAFKERKSDGRRGERRRTPRDHSQSVGKKAF